MLTWLTLLSRVCVHVVLWVTLQIEACTTVWRYMRFVSCVGHHVCLGELADWILYHSFNTYGFFLLCGSWCVCLAKLVDWMVYHSVNTHGLFALCGSSCVNSLPQFQHTCHAIQSVGTNLTAVWRRRVHVRSTSSIQYTPSTCLYYSAHFLSEILGFYRDPYTKPSIKKYGRAYTQGSRVSAVL